MNNAALANQKINRLLTYKSYFDWFWFFTFKMWEGGCVLQLQTAVKELSYNHFTKQKFKKIYLFLLSN